ncbi:unnamed protein product, partial [Mesorhabditis belari]|uniref:DNA replication complex GINS protein PSF2 n=1 Tax=Mesorhabditis belari TaxID=2138241 RepID=A0AAF3EG05_9BILA
MDSEICDFLAGDELIEVIPNFTSGSIQLIGGDMGPFEAGLPVEVPLWIGINLRKRMKCVLKVPNWLLIDCLKDLITLENESNSLLQLPSLHFFEIAHIVVRDFKEDLQDGDQVKTLIQDLWDKREAKIRSSTLKFLKQSTYKSAQMDNIQQIEITQMRGPLIAATRNTERLLQNKHSTQN